MMMIKKFIPRAWTQHWQRWQARWQNLEARTQRALRWLSIVVLALIWWQVAWEPAHRQVPQLEKKLQLQRAEGEQILALLAQVKQFQNTPPPIATPALAGTLEAWRNLDPEKIQQQLKAVKIRGAEVKLENNQWVITLAQASFNLLYAWLEQAASQGWVVQAMRAERVGSGDQVRVELHLGRASGNLN